MDTLLHVTLSSILSTQIPYTSISIGDVLWALIVLTIGFVIIKIFLRVFRRGLETIGLPPLAAGVLTRLVSVILYIALALATASAMGIKTGFVTLSLSAVLGLILGFGLQDTFSNLAAGVWLAVLRPFSKGDFVKIAGYSGSIVDIGIMSTVLKLPGGEIAMIPNKSVWGSPIVNYTREPVRRFNFTVGVAYGTDLDKAIRVGLSALKSIPEVLEDPAPQAIITELADSSINIELRGYAKKEDLLMAKHKAIKAVYEAYNAEGIEIPFPQIDVHLRKGEA